MNEKKSNNQGNYNTPVSYANKLRKHYIYFVFS